MSYITAPPRRCSASSAAATPASRAAFNNKVLHPHHII